MILELTIVILFFGFVVFAPMFFQMHRETEVDPSIECDYREFLPRGCDDCSYKQCTKRAKIEKGDRTC